MVGYPKRNLYIIKAEQPDSEDRDSLIWEQTRKTEKLRVSLTEAIGESAEVTHFFTSKATRPAAFVQNAKLNLALASLVSVDGLLEKWGHKVQNTDGVFTYNSFLALYHLNQKGIKTRFQTTERKDQDNPKAIIMEHYRNHRQYGNLTKHFESEFRRQYRQDTTKPAMTQPLLDIWGIKRDTAIYQNVLNNGGQENILYVAPSHKLKEFYKKTHDFNVYDTSIRSQSDQPLVVGELPIRMEPAIQKLEEKMVDTDFEISYVNK